MKTMAVMDVNQVINIIVADDKEPETESLITYDESNPACIGGDYVDGYFYLPQPFPSWSRHEGKWIPPFPRPEGVGFMWNEEMQQWIEV